MAGSTSPKKKAATPASQDKKKSSAAPAKEGTGADIRNFVSPLFGHLRWSLTQQFSQGSNGVCYSILLMTGRPG